MLFFYVCHLETSLFNFMVIMLYICRPSAQNPNSRFLFGFQPNLLLRVPIVHLPCTCVVFTKHHTSEDYTSFNKIHTAFLVTRKKQNKECFVLRNDSTTHIEAQPSRKRSFLNNNGSGDAHKLA